MAAGSIIEVLRTAPSGRNRQTFYLFLSSVVIVFAGMGLFPLLPLYAARFGATRTVTGFYLAVTYVAISAGSMLPGWLAGRVSRRTLFTAAGMLGIPALALMGQATALWQAVALTAIVWLVGGVELTLASVLTGLHAEGKNRGKSFSLMSLANPLGAVFGGAAVGYLVDRQGYPLTFAVLGALWVALPLLGLVALEEGEAARQAPKARPAGADDDGAAAAGRPPLGRSFYVLLLASVLAATAVNAGRLGTSLSMQALSFSASAVASTATVSGLVAIPVTFFIGALSDRLGRRGFLALGYSLAAGGSLALALATQLWHFWVAATLLLVSRSVSTAMASALASDVLAPQALGRALPRLNAANYAAGVASFAGAGYVMDALGPTALYLFSVLLAIVAVAQAGLSRDAAARLGHMGWHRPAVVLGPAGAGGRWNQ